jgi:two-component system sensor histidine kinase RegB
VVAATGASNLALDPWSRRQASPSDDALGAVFAFDTLLLTALLYFSGGPANPFSAFYLVHVTLAAVALGMRWAAAIVALSAASYAGLFFAHVKVPAMEHAHHSGSAFSVHLQGMWGALTIAASLIAYVVTRLANALRARDAELLRIRSVAERNERLASLTTLAAGAAHELGTPLGTIAIVAKELERSIRTDPDEALADARLIREELLRCRAIVSRMSASAGQAVGELAQPTTTRAVVEALLARLDGAARARLDVRLTDGPLDAPLDGLVQVLANLVNNGLLATRDASSSDAPKGASSRVTVTAEAVLGLARFTVEDEGRGIAAADLARVGEPFFTTRPPGQGMGLGLFLARAFAEQNDGQLRLDSEEGKGTRATLELPAAAAARRQATR